MFRSTSRAVRRTIAFILTLPALAACSDEQAPSPLGPGLRGTRQLAAGDVVTVTNASGGTSVGSIRWATSVATAGQIIRFDPSLDGATIVLDSTLLVPTDVTIEGPKARGITLSGNDQRRVMHVLRKATLKNLTVTRGYHAQTGGGIYSDSTVMLENSTVSYNQSPGVGGIRAHTVGLLNSTVARNTGNGYASGIAFSQTSGRAFVINSTIAQNSPAPGLAPYGVYGGHGPLFKNSIVAQNGMPLQNCGELRTADFIGTSIADDFSCFDIMLYADPMFGTFGDHGGPSATFDLTHRSPAINAGQDCIDATTDQRYVPRDANCDAGAYEFTDFTIVTITIDNNATVIPADGIARVTGTIKCSRNGDIFGVLVKVQQQKGGKNPTTVLGEGGAGVHCTTAVQPWTAVISPSSGGTFDTGSASVTASTNDTDTWIKRTTVSKSVRFRK